MVSKVMLGLPIGAMLLAGPAVAQTQTLYLEQLLRQPPIIRVYPGHSVSLSWIDSGAVIEKAWLDDPSHIGLSFDRVLCSGSTCNRGSGATVIQIKRIKPIQFEHLLSSPTGETTLTVIANSGGKRQRYQFIVVPANGRAMGFTAYDMKPGTSPEISVRPALPPLPNRYQSGAKTAGAQPNYVQTTPSLLSWTTPDLANTLQENTLHASPRMAFVVPQCRTSTNPSGENNFNLNPPAAVGNKTGTTLKVSIQTSLTKLSPQQKTPISVAQPRGQLQPLPKSPANALAMGLRLAIDPTLKQKPVAIAEYSFRYSQVNSAIRLLRTGQSITAAARATGIPLTILHTLIQMGGGSL